MNKFKRAQNVREFYKTFRENKKELIKDKDKMKYFKKQLRFHTGYTNKKIDELIKQWLLLSNLEDIEYLLALTYGRDKEWEKEQRRLFKVGRRCK